MHLTILSKANLFFFSILFETPPEFDHDNLAIGIKEAHELGKKFYVVVNIQPHNSKLKNFIRDLAPVVAMQPDALIMSDPGLIMLVREHFPEMDIHLSVQANAVNWATVKFWKKYAPDPRDSVT